MRRVEAPLPSRNSLPFQITLKRYANSIVKQSPWLLKFCKPLGLGSTSRTINGSRYSSSRASVVVRALRIMPLFIAISLLLLFDLHGMAIGALLGLETRNQTGICPQRHMHRQTS